MSGVVPPPDPFTPLPFTLLPHPYPPIHPLQGRENTDQRFMLNVAMSERWVKDMQIFLVSDPTLGLHP